MSKKSKSKSNDEIPYLTIILVFIVFFVIFFYIFKNFLVENFEFFSNYLFPVKGLQKICEEKGLAPAYGPQSCFKDGKYDPYSNCECLDKKTGECKSCYPNIKRDERSSSVVYDAKKF